MDEWDIREPAICRALTRMQFVAIDNNSKDRVVNESRISDEDFNRLYNECFEEVDRYIRELEAEKQDFRARIQAMEAQIDAAQKASIFR